MQTLSKASLVTLYKARFTSKRYARTLTKVVFQRYMKYAFTLNEAI